MIKRSFLSLVLVAALSIAALAPAQAQDVTNEDALIILAQWEQVKWGTISGCWSAGWLWGGSPSACMSQTFTSIYASAVSEYQSVTATILNCALTGNEACVEYWGQIGLAWTYVAEDIEAGAQIYGYSYL